MQLTEQADGMVRYELGMGITGSHIH